MVKKVTKYGKAHSVRLKLETEKKLAQDCLANNLNEADIIRMAVECYLSNPKCHARGFRG